MLTGRYFDGRSAAGQLTVFSMTNGQVLLHTVHDNGLMQPSAELGELSFEAAISAVDFGEPNQQGKRIIRLPTGGQFIADDTAALNAYLAQQPIKHSIASKLIGSWKYVALSIVGIAVAVWMLYKYIIPFAAYHAAPLVPQKLVDQISDVVYSQLLRQTTPSDIPQAQQDELNKRWEEVLEKAYPAGDAPKHRIVFRKWAKVKNALALPNGTIILTDEMVKFLADNPDGMMGVLAHELGHVEGRHGLRMVMQASAVAVMWSVVTADVSGVLAQAPLIMGTLEYGKGFESDADDTAIRIMRAANIDPIKLAHFFEKISAPQAKKVEKNDKGEKKGSGLNIPIPEWLSTHPSDASRIKKFKEAGL